MDANATADTTALLAECERLRERAAQLERDLLRFRTIVEDTDLLITEVDANGLFTYVNQAAQRVFGYSPAECIGRFIARIRPSRRPRRRQASICRACATS